MPFVWGYSGRPAGVLLGCIYEWSLSHKAHKETWAETPWDPHSATRSLKKRQWCVLLARGTSFWLTQLHNLLSLQLARDCAASAASAAASPCGWVAPNVVRSQLYTSVVAVHVHFESFLRGCGSATFSALKHCVRPGEVWIPLVHLDGVPACELLAAQLACEPWCLSGPAWRRRYHAGRRPRPYTVKGVGVAAGSPTRARMEAGGQGDCTAHGACNETPHGLLLHGQACRRGSSTACLLVAEVEGAAEAAEAAEGAAVPVLLAVLRW